MTEPERVDALRLIDRLILKIQACYNPGRTEFLALDRLSQELRRARTEVSAGGLEAASRP